MSHNDRRVVKLLLDRETHAMLMEHSRVEGVSPGVVVWVALRRQLELFPKR